MTRVILFISVFFCYVAGAAYACSCPPPPAVSKAFDEASAVFLGKVISVRLELQRDPHGKSFPGYFFEYATLKVERAWKGVKTGQLVKIKSNIGPGPCGLSCRNSPAWVEMRFWKLDSYTRRHPEELMKEWIVYFYGTEPYEISMCTRSLPVGLGGSDDIAELDRIVAHRR